MVKQVDYDKQVARVKEVEEANSFLKNIAEEQTKKINELTLKETKTHNKFVRVESEVVELKEKLKELTHKHDLLECSSKEEAECRGLIRRDEEWYGDAEDWVWGYGYKQTIASYVINISGGGDGVSPHGFEDWVIKIDSKGKLGYYIRHGGDIPDKLQVGKKLISCPDGNYISFQDEDYEPFLEELDFDWLEDELKNVCESDIEDLT